MLLPGQMIGNHYEIRGVLGSGSFSTVYLAHDAQFPGGRRVALKEFNPDAFSEADRIWARDTIAQEARLRGNIPSHSGLASVLGYFEVGERSYLVLEYVEGRTLEAAWRAEPGRRFAEQQVLYWADQLCDVLTFLHEQARPIIYRDLKPANIMVQPDGSLKLIDFGIARLHQPQRQGDTVNLGTPGYAAPEQYRDEQSDARTDIYALGVILHQLLTGLDPADYIMSLPPLHIVNEAISPGVAMAIEQAMALAPDHRFRTARALANALQRVNSSATSVEPAEVQGRRNRSLKAAGSLFVLALTAAILIFLLSENDNNGNDNAPAIPREVGAAETGAFVNVASTEVGDENATATRNAALGGTGTAQQMVADTVAMTGTARVRQAVTAQASSEAVERGAATGSVTLTATNPPPSPAATVMSDGLPSSWVGSDGMRMLIVPAGEFIMGSTEAGVQQAVQLCRNSGEGNCGADQFANEMSQRTVYLDAYYIDLTEVTNGQYAVCVQAGSCSAPLAGSSIYQPDSYYYNAAYSDYPVVHVTWYDARAYCRWAEKALPTEAQWEKAARGTDGRTFPWGDQWNCANSNTQECGGDRLHPVGSFPTGASPYGVMDMAGGVWEWVEDAFDAGYYGRATDHNPPAATTGSARVLRGGSYSNFQHFARTANRGYETAGTATAYRGFRCVLPADQITP